MYTTLSIGFIEIIKISKNEIACGFKVRSENRIKEI